MLGTDFNGRLEMQLAKDGRENPPSGTETAEYLASAALSLATAWLLWIAGIAVYRVLSSRVHGWPAYFVICAAVMLFASGGILHRYRDRRAWRPLAVLQIAAGCLGGALALFMSDNPMSVSAVVGYLGAIVTVADGFAKLSELARKHAGSTDHV